METPTEPTVARPQSATERFVASLCSLAGDVTHPGDRAALAELRRAATGEVRDALRVYPYVARLAPPSQLENYVLVASLFGMHPTKRSQRSRAISLARALRFVSQKNKEGDSIERRFMALLQCNGEELPIHLRHAVALAKAHDCLLAWSDILSAVNSWGHDHRRSQRRWAKEFWSAAPEEDNTSTKDK